MSNNKGIRIGKYRITPLGIGTMAALVVIVIALVVVLIVDPFGGAPDSQNVHVAAKPSSTAAQSSASPVPTLAPTPTPEPRSATIRSLGEIAMETDLLMDAFDSESNSFDFSGMFSEIADVMGNADYTVADVEGTMGDTKSVSGSGATMFTPSALLTALKDAGVDMLTLANDHALDGGFAEQQATVKNVAAAGLAYVGAATSAEEKATPVIQTINGIKVGFVAYTDSLRGLETQNDPAAVQYGVNLVQYCNAVSDVQNARAAGAEVVIAYVSWGEMLNRAATPFQQQIAMALCSAGVDVIIGYNPHVTQPAGWLEAQRADGSGTQRTLCLLSAGNFLSNQRAQYADSGVIFEFTIQEQPDGSFAIVDPVYIPTYVMRKDNGDNTYEYHTLAVGQWKDGDYETAPEGMSYTDFERMKAVWSEMQTVMGSGVATIAAE